MRKINTSMVCWRFRRRRRWWRNLKHHLKYRLLKWKRSKFWLMSKLRLLVQKRKSWMLKLRKRTWNQQSAQLLLRMLLKKWLQFRKILMLLCLLLRKLRRLLLAWTLRTLRCWKRWIILQQLLLKLSGVFWVCYLVFNLMYQSPDRANSMLTEMAGKSPSN